MYFYKLEYFDYDEHWKTIYCSQKKYSDEEFKKIVKDAYIETCKYISDSKMAFSEFDYRVQCVIFDILGEYDHDKSKPWDYFNKILKDRHDLRNLDDCIYSKLEFAASCHTNNNLEEFYEERNGYTLVGISDDDFIAYS